MFALYPKTVPFESHSLTADVFAAMAFSECTHTLDPKHFEILRYLFSLAAEGLTEY
jgi:hypothetical protein